MFGQSLRNQKGYGLAVVVMFTSVLLVTLLEAAVNWQTVTKREREEELIFRGKQFQRALLLWYRHFRKTLGPNVPVPYPPTIDALLNTGNHRFLRKKWKDPVSGSQEWRLIQVNPEGSPILTVPPSQSYVFGKESPQINQSPYNNDIKRDKSGQDQLKSRSGGLESRQTRTAYGETLKTQPLTSSPIIGLAGVASTSEKESLKTYNGHSNYNEWEFFVDFRALAMRERRIQRNPSGPSSGQTRRSRQGQRSSLTQQNNRIPPMPILPKGNTRIK
ncbi:MAG: hypothetical protein MK025_12745 [Acidobacteriia bacterium]|nr:hypothetical protein [Terriglobia bacterium]